MTYHNNEKSAYEVAQNRIQREEAFINTDYEKLSFEEKCRYALDILGDKPLIEILRSCSNRIAYRLSHDAFKCVVSHGKYLQK